MTTRHKSRRRVALAKSLVALPLLALPLAGHAQDNPDIGAAGAVNPVSRSQPPGSGARVLELGNRIIFRERIQTSAQGSVQLVFLDKSTMNIGPNTDLIIDEFVYDPKSGTGKMAATLGKGVLRFVGGQISHTTGATIRTPATTLGIRGGVATVSHDQQQGTRAINHFGTLTAQTSSGVEVVRRPGFAINIATGGGSGGIARAPQGEIDGSNRQLRSQGGQTGGAPSRPTDQTAQGAGLGQSQAGLQPINILPQQGQTVSPRQSAPPAGEVNQPLQRELQRNNQNASQQAANQQTAQQNPVVPSPPTPSPPTPPPPVSIPARYYALAIDGNPPYLPANFIASGVFRNSKALGYGAGGLNPDGTPNKTTRMLQAGAAINGTGSGQSSTLYVATTTVYQAAGTGELILNGGMVATTRRGANLSAGRANSAITSLPGTLTVTSDATPTAARVNQNDVDANDQIVSQTAFANPGGGVGGANYTFTQNLSTTSTPSGLGASRPVATLTGYVGGLMRSFSTNANAPVAPTFQVAGSLAVDLAEPSRFGAYMGIVNVDPTPSDTFDTAFIALGYQGPGTRSRSAYIDYDNFGARDAELVGAGANLTQVNGAPVDAHRAAFVTSKTVEAQSLLPNVPICQCEFTRWGFWSTETRRTVGSDVHRDILHMGTWIAGQTPDVGQVPTTGVATYSGHAIASIKTGGNEYIAGGSFTNVVNFGTQTGNVTIGNLDSRNYSGQVFLGSSDPRSFVGNLSAGATAPTHTGALVGGFYRGASGPVGEMGGMFWVQDAGGTGSYLGSGTFLAKTP